MPTEIKWERIRDLARRHGLPIDEQAYFYRIGRGRRVMHVSRKDPPTRIDLKGLDELARRHRAIRQISAEQAQRGHLGKVRGQIDFSRSEEEILAAIEAALRKIREENGGPSTPAPSRGEPPDNGGTDGPTRFELTLPDELAQAILETCEELRRRVPRGLESEVTPTSTIRVLLHEAVQARRLPAPRLSSDEEGGLRLALRQAREGKIHTAAEARKVIDAALRR
jgi:hypothetical protein